MDVMSGVFWAALGSIILANIVLSGDNAVVIAMAARTLKPEQQQKAIFWGSAAAIVMRIILTVVAARLLTLPFLKLIGAMLLGYIGVNLLAEGDGGEEEGKEINSMGAAIRTILVADLVMSLDNVLAVAAAAKGNVTLLIVGLAVSIPLIIFGSTLLIKVMERFPIIITGGAALLGFLAGEMLVTDPAVVAQFGEQAHWVAQAVGALGAALVVMVGMWLAKRHAEAVAKAAARAEHHPGTTPA